MPGDIGFALTFLLFSFSLCQDKEKEKAASSSDKPMSWSHELQSLVRRPI